MADNILRAIITADGSQFTQAVNNLVIPIGQLQQRLIQLKKDLINASDPSEISRLNTAIIETRNQIQQAEAATNGFANSTFGISRAARTAHSDLDEVARSIQLVGSGSQGAGIGVSNLVFTFERLAGQTGGVEAAMGALGKALLSPAGIAIAIASLIPLIGSLIDSFDSSSEAAKKFKKTVDDLQASLDKLKEPINITIGSAIGSVAGDINKIRALIFAATNEEKINGVETEASIKRRQSAFAALQSSYSKEFENLKFQKDLTNEVAIEQAGQQAIAALGRKTSEEAISKQTSEAQTLSNVTQANIDNLKRERDAKLASLGVTEESVKAAIKFRNETQAPIIISQGISAPEDVFIPVIGEDVINTFQKQIDKLIKIKNDADVELSKRQIVETQIVVDQASEQDFKSKTEDETKKIIELGKKLSSEFEANLKLSAIIFDSDSEKVQFEKAEVLIKQFRDHIEQDVLKDFTLVPKIELPKSIPEVDKVEFQKSVAELSKEILIPLKSTLDTPSINEVTQQLQNIFGKVGEGLGSTLRTALQKEIDVFDKGFTVNLAIPTDVSVKALTESAAKIRATLTEDLKTENFQQALQTLVSLGDVGEKAGEDTKQAFLDAGASMADAVKAGEALKKSIGGITDTTAEIAKSFDSILTPSIKGFFDAITKGKDPVKAFFDSLIKSIDDLISKLISLAVQKAIINILASVAGGSGQPAASPISAGVALPQAVPFAGQVAAAPVNAALATLATTAGGVTASLTPMIASIAAFNASLVPALAAINAFTFAVATAAATEASIAAAKAAVGFLAILGFAEGGDPPVNKPSIVGEKGWEIFVPRAAGTIIPHDKAISMIASADETKKIVYEYKIDHYSDKIVSSLSNLVTKLNESVKNITTNLATNLVTNISTNKGSVFNFHSSTNNDKNDRGDSSMRSLIELLVQHSSIAYGKQIINNSIEQISENLKSFYSLNSSNSTSYSNRASNHSEFRVNKFTELITSMNEFFSSVSYRSSGGSVAYNRPFIVGEKEPEIFIPKQNGFIVPLSNFNSSISDKHERFSEVIKSLSLANISGFRQAGGPVTSGAQFVVGEGGSEIFVPNLSSLQTVASKQLNLKPIANQVMIPDVRLDGNDIVLSWSRTLKSQGRST